MPANRTGKDHLIHLAELVTRNPDGTYDTSIGVVEECESSGWDEMSQPSDTP